MSYLRNLARTMDEVSIPFYVEYPNGNCSIVRTTEADKQNLKRREGAKLIRPATTDDITDFVRQGGAIR